MSTQTDVRVLLKANGEIHLYDGRVSYAEISRLVAGGGATDTVMIKRGVSVEMKTGEIEYADGRVDLDTETRIDFPAGLVMIVDDTGLVDGKPPNRIASMLYAAQCHPEFAASAVIAGDAFLCPDEDFA